MVRIRNNAPKGIVKVIGAKGHVDVNRFIWIFWSIKFNYHPINRAGQARATRNSAACGEPGSAVFYGTRELFAQIPEKM